MRRPPSLGEYAFPMTAPLEVDPAELQALAGVLVELGTDVAASGNTPDAVSATEPSIVAALFLVGTPGSATAADDYSGVTVAKRVGAARPGTAALRSASTSSR